MCLGKSQNTSIIRISLQRFQFPQVPPVIAIDIDFVKFDRNLAITEIGHRFDMDH